MPVTLVFIIVLVFNISFTSGAVNGFILFSQLLQSLDIDAKDINIFTDTRIQGYRIVYGFFDVNFFQLRISFLLPMEACFCSKFSSICLIQCIFIWRMAIASFPSSLAQQGNFLLQQTTLALCSTRNFLSDHPSPSYFALGLPTVQQIDGVLWM